MEEQASETDRLYVPVRGAGCCCTVSLQLFRDRDGSRCAVGFTTPERLARVLGAQQEYYRLTVRTVRELARERGAHALVVDPGLAAVAVRDDAEPVGTRRRPALDPARSPGQRSAK